MDYTNSTVDEKKYFSETSSKKLLIQELKYMYYAEKHTLKLLQRLEKAASTKYLKASFNGHCMATLEHVKRLEKIFHLLNEKSSTKKCSVTEELTRLASQIIKTTKKYTLERDLGLILVAEKIEGFEIRKYNELVGLANDLGDFKLVFYLEEILIEEKEAAETFEAVKEDTLRDEQFALQIEIENSESEMEEFDAVEENV